MPVKVSIVIPTYNRPYLLKRCINALKLQDFPKAEYEIIVITDGPDKETLTMISHIFRK